MIPEVCLKVGQFGNSRTAVVFLVVEQFRRQSENNGPIREFKTTTTTCKLCDKLSVSAVEDIGLHVTEL